MAGRRQHPPPFPPSSCSRPRDDAGDATPRPAQVDLICTLSPVHWTNSVNAWTENLLRRDAATPPDLGAAEDVGQVPRRLNAVLLASVMNGLRSKVQRRNRRFGNVRHDRRVAVGAAAAARADPDVKFLPPMRERSPRPGLRSAGDFRRIVVPDHDEARQARRRSATVGIWLGEPHVVADVHVAAGPVDGQRRVWTLPISSRASAIRRRLWSKTSRWPYRRCCR